MAETKHKHTAGPWHRNIKPARKYNCIFAGETGNHTHVAYLATSGMTDAEIEANCDLILAAPELLEALEELRDLVEEIRVGAYKPDSFTLQIADKAIAKATGQVITMCEHVWDAEDDCRYCDASREP